jgi:DNA sulfur modification protein DndE
VHYSKLKISADAERQLRWTRNRTGITPALLCRYALLASLEDGPLGNVPPPDQDGSEFNAYTLTGEYTELLFEMLRFVEQADGAELTDEELMTRLRGHIHRGVGGLSVRVKSAADLFRVDAGLRV